MQTCFFHLSGVLPSDEAITLLKQSIVDTFKKKGDKVCPYFYLSAYLCLLFMFLSFCISSFTWMSQWLRACRLSSPTNLLLTTPLTIWSSLRSPLPGLLSVCSGPNVNIILQCKVGTFNFIRVRGEASVVRHRRLRSCQMDAWGSGPLHWP